jgi:transcriptional regulator with GAF, ATPase, and Fis domain
MITSIRLDDFKSSFESISLLTGEAFFKNVVKEISSALAVDAVWIAELHKEQNSMTTLAFIYSGDYRPDFTYLLDGTPCEQVINSSTFVHYSDRLVELFPVDHNMLASFNSESYVGLSLRDPQGNVIGNLAILDSKPIKITANIEAVFKIIKSRVESELYRVRREKEILRRENQLRGLINGVQDLLINMDHRGKILMLNTVAESALGADTNESNLHISTFLRDNSKSKLLTMIESFEAKGKTKSCQWIPDHLEVSSRNGYMLKAEGTLSRYELDEKIYYTLVLRQIDNEARSDESVRRLVDETEYLRGELEEIKDSNQLIGESNAMKRLLQNVYMVAHTDATVLINGETGTGKELVAQHIHQISHRRSKPLVSVNCGAIPATLIESEFFGHAKGAFTGATAERKGRFQLADGGTIFLDEIGELPLDLQVKLLRVIQEGELEPVGSSKTIRVDVRIIAATHQNLFQLIRENKFREDLYYRLNVFPVEIPPLRERQDDIILIANSFINKFGKRLSKKFGPLTSDQKTLLKSHVWPGNVRELQNIIERSAILSQNGALDLHATLGRSLPRNANESGSDENRILTKDEMLEFERKNIIRALKAANWKVSGKDGAAALLKMVPSTLSSRIAALEIKMQ